MPNDPQDEQDNYEAAELDDGADLDEDERIALEASLEKLESRREILLGQIAVARRALYAAEDAGDVAGAALLEQKIAKLNRERDGGPTHG